MRLLRNCVSLSVAALAGLLAQPANAQVCGQTLGTTGGTTPITITLTDDLNCVTSIGLIVKGSNVTINLNNHSIRSQQTTFAAIRWLSGSNLTINGPGKLVDFPYGLYASGGSSQPDLSPVGPLLVQGVTFNSIGVGVRIAGPTGGSFVGPVEFRQNTFSGGQVGIFLQDVGGGKIKANKINGGTTAGIYIRHNLKPMTITQNTVLGAFNGLWADASNLHMTLNRFDNNTNSGVMLQAVGNNVVQSNRASGNGQDGFHLGLGGIDNAFTGLFEDNKANANGRYGVFVDYYSTGKVVDNQGKGNAVADLFADPFSGATCFKYNRFAVPVPATLPVCQ